MRPHARVALAERALALQARASSARCRTTRTTRRPTSSGRRRAWRRCLSAPCRASLRPVRCGDALQLLAPFVLDRPFSSLLLAGKRMDRLCVG
eukprot:6193115-Pleurochrysis_carterae.AAC.3